MSKSSTAYVTCEIGGKTYTYHFTGVTSIEHNLALNLNNKDSQGMDIVNGARNLPNQVTLSVVETDTEHPAGWAASGRLGGPDAGVHDLAEEAESPVQGGHVHGNV